MNMQSGYRGSALFDAMVVVSYYCENTGRCLVLTVMEIRVNPYRWHPSMSPGSQPTGGLQPSGLLLHFLCSDLGAGAAAEEEGSAGLQPLWSHHRLL